MQLSQEKQHMLATMKQDYDINVKLDKKADQHTDKMSAELSAFFVAHSVDDHIDSGILTKAPNAADISRLKKLAEQLPRTSEINAKKRKMAFLTMGVSDMEMYVQSLLGLLMLPFAIDSFKLFESTLNDEFKDEYKRQANDTGIKATLPDSKVQELSHASFDKKTPSQAYWTSFDKTLASLSIEISKAIQQGVSAKQWAIITGGM
jgi:hypothetical protein